MDSSHIIVIYFIYYFVYFHTVLIIFLKAQSRGNNRSIIIYYNSSAIFDKGNRYHNRHTFQYKEAINIRTATNVTAPHAGNRYLIKKTVNV